MKTFAIGMIFTAIFLGQATQAMAAEENDKYIWEVQVPDPAFQLCIQQWAGKSYTGYTRVSQVLELGCAHYGIESIEGIEMFKSLHAIDLSHNFIVDYAPLFKLATYMRWVWLWNTPIRCSDIPILRKNLPYAFLGGIDPFECIPN